MRLVERHIIKDNRFEDICLKSGLFQSSVNKLINADINGAIGIGRKVFGDSYVNRIIDSGLAFNPIKVNIS